MSEEVVVKDVDKEEVAKGVEGWAVEEPVVVVAMATPSVRQRGRRCQWSHYARSLRCSCT